MKEEKQDREKVVNMDERGREEDRSRDGEMKGSDGFAGGCRCHHCYCAQNG
jgi:hypothetical protein